MIRFLLLGVLVSVAVSDLFQDAEDIRAVGNMEDLLFKEEKEMAYSNPEKKRSPNAVLNQFNSVKHSPMNVRKLEMYLRELEDAEQQVTRALSHEEIARRISKIKEILDRRQTCDSTSPGFRTIDGSCNNLVTVRRGAAGETILKKLPNDYDDGLSTPRTKTSNDRDLPNARDVSNAVFGNIRIQAESLTALTMHFGQVTDHDLVAVHGQDVVCENCADGAECFPITLDSSDAVFGSRGSSCFDFTRSESVDDAAGVRQHVNSVTSYLDASFVYGSEDSEASALRGSDGKMNATEDPVTNLELLPHDTDLKECVGTSAGVACGLAGDGRAAEQPGLTSLHTMFLREHNRIAEKLKEDSPALTSDEIYNKARKIVGAEWQHIVYNEFLPLIVDATMYADNQLGKEFYSYEDTMDPSISNTFAAAAFRFGHTLVPFELLRVDANYDEVYPHIDMLEAFFNASFIYEVGIPDGALDSIIRGMVEQSAFKVDGEFATALTHNLFGEPTVEGDGFDLTALNIQRARDQGLPSYNVIRKDFCNNNKNIRRDIETPVLDKLKSVYGNQLKDIDAFVGLVLETPRNNILVGRTLSCIFADQFSRLKSADRFFYLNPDQFNSAQIAEIKKVTMARVICDNVKDVTNIQPYAFAKDQRFGNTVHETFTMLSNSGSWPSDSLLEGLNNERRPCSGSFIPQLDVSQFV